MRWGNILKACMKTIIGTLVALMILEVGVRIVIPVKRFDITVATWDREIGTKNIAGARGTSHNTEYTMGMFINSKGLRDREFSYEKPEGTKRVLCLGDSYTFGYGVQAEETFSKRLEENLVADQNNDMNWEVLNAGVGSTGTAHQLAYFKNEGYKYDPDLVVLCFLPANDFMDNITSGLYSLEGSNLVKHDAPITRGRKIQRMTRYVPFFDTLMSRSHLMNVLRMRISALHYCDLEKQNSTPDNYLAILAERDLLTRHLVLELAETCEEKGCPLVMMVIPPLDETMLPVRVDDLIQQATAHGVPCLDLSGDFAAEEKKGELLAFPKDGHWNAKGHRLAADALYGFLAPKLEEPTPMEF